MPDTTPTTEASPLRPMSRAALRSVEAGNYVDCACCGERVKFQAKLRKQQVICNVYIEGRWDRVEHYHAECYDAAGQPHGSPTEQPERVSRGRSTAA
ncbi:MAG: hypothetical protein QOJ19_4700 [Acidimicrobiia bacterium]|jgi:hypothetical protein|nr:hypothetical protein [Acidimicrobiia bacterium]